MATRQKSKNGHNSATAQAKCKNFFPKMQNTQVPIYSQYIILAYCSIFQVKTKNEVTWHTERARLNKQRFG